MSHVEIIYDGDCPVCSAYVRMHRLRQEGHCIHLTDAREHPELVNHYAARGIDLNSDFVLKINGAEYIGGDAIFVLASISTQNSVLRKINAKLLASRSFARVVYPLLRVSRWSLLVLMRRQPISVR